MLQIDNILGLTSFDDFKADPRVGINEVVNFEGTTSFGADLKFTLSVALFADSAIMDTVKAGLAASDSDPASAALMNHMLELYSDYNVAAILDMQRYEDANGQVDLVVIPCIASAQDQNGACFFETY